MPRPHTAMRKIREVLRLRLGEGLSHRKVAAALGLPTSTVTGYVQRAQIAGVTWPLPPDMDDEELESRLFGPPPATARSKPDFAKIHLELKGKGVTLTLLWLEYRESDPDGYGYSQFCELYRRWRATTDLVMRQSHKAGEKCFVDYSGTGIPIYAEDLTTVDYVAELFVAVMGASSYLYAEATRSQELFWWISSHENAFAFFGAVPRLLVPDNLRSGVSQAHRYEPDINPTYAEMATHYGCVVMPARAYRPRDKAKAEAGVLFAQRWILARLRRRRFTSLEEANAAIAVCVAELNSRPYKKMPGSRVEVFTSMDLPAMGELPEYRYDFAIWKTAKVGIDYHVEVREDSHYYSVPHRLVGSRVELRISARCVEVFHSHQRVASHLRVFGPGHSTEISHMPIAHRRHAEWTPERLVQWAARTGESTAALVAGIMERRPHPEHGYRSCLGIMRLSKRYGPERLEAACTRALALGSYNYRSVSSILAKGLDARPLSTPVPRTNPEHTNLRGAGYYS